MTSSTQKLQLTPQDQSQIRTSLNNALNAILNHVTIFFTHPPPKELPSYLVSPNPNSALPISRPSTPAIDSPTAPSEDTAGEWSFLPRHSSALATCKWGFAILEVLAKRAVDFISWSEDAGDAVRIAVSGVRERLVRAALMSWQEGITVMQHL